MAEDNGPEFPWNVPANSDLATEITQSADRQQFLAVFASAMSLITSDRVVEEVGPRLPATLKTLIGNATAVGGRLAQSDSREFDSRMRLQSENWEATRQILVAQADNGFTSVASITEVLVTLIDTFTEANLRNNRGASGS